MGIMTMARPKSMAAERTMSITPPPPMAHSTWAPLSAASFVTRCISEAQGTPEVSSNCIWASVPEKLCASFSFDTLRADLLPTNRKDRP